MKQDYKPKAADLRLKAEKQLKKRQSKPVPHLSEAEIRKLIHEFEVRQIELELQKEELMMSLKAVRDEFDLYDFAPSGYFSLSKKGEILNVNFVGSKILGKESSRLLNCKFDYFISDDTKPIFSDFFRNMYTSQVKESCEVTLSNIGNVPVYVHLNGIVTGNGELSIITLMDITERKKLNDAQTFLLQCGYPGSGEDFFKSLARYLAQSLDMDYVCIDRLEGDGLNAQTVAIFNNGIFDANSVYALKDTPCGDVVGKTICCFPADVCRLFPHDIALKELKAESYVGTTLWGFDHKPIGLIAVIGRKPLRDQNLAKAMLNLAAMRAAGELERTLNETELQQSKQRLEMAQKSAGAGIWDWDMVSHRLHWSKELYQLFGMDPLKDEASFETWSNMIHPDDKDIARFRIEQAIRNKTSLDSEYRVIYKGEVHWICALGNTTYNADENPVKMMGICIDITLRKQAEEALRASEERLRTITDNAPDMIVELDRQGTILYMNRILPGYKMSEVVGKNFSSWTRPEYVPLIMNALEQTFASGAPQSSQVQGYGANGEIRWYLFRLSAVNADAKVTSAIAIVSDITERIQREDTIKESERRRLAILETAMDGFWLFDRDGRLLEVNETYCRMSGYSAQELLAMHIPDLEDNETTNETIAHIQRIMELGEDRFESRHRRKDGSIFDLEISIQFQPVDGGQFVTFLHDITERKKAEKALCGLNEELEDRVNERTAQLLLTNVALQQSEEKFRTVADYNYDWEYWISAEGSYTYVSPSCERISGYSAQEFLQDPQLIYKIIHPEDVNDFSRHIAHQLQFQDTCETEFRIIAKDGTEKWIGHVCQPVFGVNGEFSGKRGSNRDITEKVKTEMELLSITVDVEERERNRFSGELHDGLGPLLSTIKLYFQWLAETDDVEKIKVITEKGNNNIERAIQTTREMAHGISSLMLNNYGFTDAVQNFIQSINDTQKITIDFTFSSDERFSNLLEITLFRISNELISNTLKYAKATHIKIEFNHDKERKIITFTYIDNGIGFDLAGLEKTNKGLGLMNIQQRIKVLKGSVRIETSIGKGTKVYIRLPDLGTLY